VDGIYFVPFFYYLYRNKDVGLCLNWCIVLCRVAPHAEEWVSVGSVWESVNCCNIVQSAMGMWWDSFWGKKQDITSTLYSFVLFFYVTFCFFTLFFPNTLKVTLFGSSINKEQKSRKIIGPALLLETETEREKIIQTWLLASTCSIHFIRPHK